MRLVAGNSLLLAHATGYICTPSGAVYPFSAKIQATRCLLISKINPIQEKYTVFIKST